MLYFIEYSIKLQKISFASSREATLEPFRVFLSFP